MYFLCTLYFTILTKCGTLMKDFVAYLVKNLVDEPSDVNVDVYEGDRSTVVEIRVSPTDVAKVVGRQGRTIKALRTIAMTVGARFDRKVRVEVVH
ncbi:MAG: hypothetical protein S4CHLAM37_03300 [Chlamydiia bacterium]|nr:hypothetical protein [Chlamydiia bacterium]